MDQNPRETSHFLAIGEPARLVGWHRRQGEPLLQTEAAYRTAINWGWKQSRSGIESLPGSRPNSPQPRYPDRELGRLAPHRADLLNRYKQTRDPRFKPTTEGHGKGKLIWILFSVHFGGFRG